MDNEIKDKLAKVKELVNRGATEGERAAAKKALEKLLKKYNLREDALNEIHLREYIFTYKNNLEVDLLGLLVQYFKYNNLFVDAYRTNQKVKNDKVVACKNIVIKCTYLQYVVLESSYEYFRRHMNKQYKLHCLPLINKCRKDKTKRKRRKELSDIFFSKYVIASNLVEKKYILTIDTSDLSKKEYNDNLMMSKVEGGNYKTQMHTSHSLTN